MNLRQTGTPSSSTNIRKVLDSTLIKGKSDLAEVEVALLVLLRG